MWRGVAHHHALHNGATLDFKTLVMHVTVDLRLGLQVQRLRSEDRAIDLAVNDNVIHAYLAHHLGVLGYHQHARLVIAADNIAMHLAINAQAAGKLDIAFHARARPHQRVDAICRFAIGFIVAKHGFVLYK